MSVLLQKMDKVEGWWWHLPNHYRWLVAAIPTAIILGLAGAVLG